MTDSPLNQVATNRVGCAKPAVSTGGVGCNSPGKTGGRSCASGQAGRSRCCWRTVVQRAVCRFLTLPSVMYDRPSNAMGASQGGADPSSPGAGSGFVGKGKRKPVKRRKRARGCYERARQLKRQYNACVGTIGCVYGEGAVMTHYARAVEAVEEWALPNEIYGE